MKKEILNEKNIENLYLLEYIIHYNHFFTLVK